MTVHTKTGTSKAIGANSFGVVACEKSKYHGFHPSNETCVMCDPDEDEDEDEKNIPQMDFSGFYIGI